MKTKTIIFWILLLTVIDQLIKIIINNYYMECRFDILLSLLEFRPMFNSNYSHVNDILAKKLNINIGLLIHLVLYLVLQLIVINIYMSFKIKLGKKDFKILDTAIIFQVSALLCGLIGNFFWDKGVLDYIYLKPLFIFDLKDIYICIFLFLFFLYTVRNKEEMKNINLDPKDVIAYIRKTKFLSRFKRSRD